MVQQQRFSQRFLVLSMLCLLTTNSFIHTGGESKKSLITELKKYIPNFLLKKKIIKLETLALMFVVLTPYAIAKRNSRSEARKLREEENLSWKDFFSINKIFTKDYWHRASYLLIGTFEKVRKDKYKKKLENGDIHVKDKTKYIPSTGLFCAIHDMITAPLKDLNEMMKNSQTFYASIIAIALLLAVNEESGETTTE